MAGACCGFEFGLGLEVGVLYFGLVRCFDVWIGVYVEFALYGTTCAVGLAVGDFVSLGCLLDVLLFAIVDLVFLWLVLI